MPTREIPAGRCPDDGYPRVRKVTPTFGGAADQTSCTNPWHPQHPGACPECGSEGLHGHPHPPIFGDTRAECADCGHEWEPDVPLARGR